MARTNLTVTFTVRWWLKAYLAGVLMMARATHCEPDLSRVRYWVSKGVKITVH